MKKTLTTKQLVFLGIMCALLIIMAFTPLGYLNVGLLAITLNIIPVAIAIVTCGTTGGIITGSLFGITSCLQCVGIGGTSAMGVALFGINPLLTIIHRFGSRFLTGLVVSIIYKYTKKFGNRAYFITGFSSAFFNTLFFMTTLILFFYNTEYLQNLIGGKNILVFACVFVGINAVFEMIASCFITGGVCSALKKGHLID